MRRLNTLPCRTGTPATRTATAGSITSSPSGARPRAATPKYPGPRWRPAQPSPGSTPASSCKGTTRSASSTRWPWSNNYQQADTGTKMIHLGKKHPQHHSLPRESPPARGRNTYRGLVKIMPTATGARNFTPVRFPAHRRQVWRAHRPLHRGAEPHRPARA